MPIPIPPPSEEEIAPLPPRGGVGTRPRPAYLREPQDWVIEQERSRHNQALYMIGEWAFLILMWTQLDFDHNLVGRCTRCFGGAVGDKNRRIAEVYKQPTQNECPVCFGTTFEGGYRARIVRPMIIADVEETERQDKKGSMHPASVSVETTVDFRTRPGDFLIRADGSRWRLTAAQRMQIRPGYEHASQLDTGVAYKMRAGLEEATTVAYRIPPTDRMWISQVLNQPLRFPGDFSDVEHVNGSLIVPSILD